MKKLHPIRAAFFSQSLLYFEPFSRIPYSKRIINIFTINQRYLVWNELQNCACQRAPIAKQSKSFLHNHVIYAIELMTFSLSYHTLKYFIQVLSFVQGRIFYIVLYLTFFPKPLRLSQARGEPYCFVYL